MKDLRKFKSIVNKTIADVELELTATEKETKAGNYWLYYKNVGDTLFSHKLLDLVNELEKVNKRITVSWVYRQYANEMTITISYRKK